MVRTDNTGIYVHIPFCRSKCPYCDFYSLVSKECPDEYVEAVIDEMKTKRRIKEFLSDGNITVDTLYFGGGTPSILSSSQLNRLVSAAKSSFHFTDDAEITVECNPSSEHLSEFLVGAAKSGVNRVSLGMQSFSASERKALGRKGTAKTVEDAVAAARNAGIDNISLDVMVGVPDSTTESLRASLDFAVSVGVPHISAYLLKIEEGTFFYNNIHKLNLPSEDEVSDMYLFMSEYLRERGYLHYEISNFCKEGFHSRHNMKYWDGVPYLGIGAAAHSFYNNKRFYFPGDLHSFINGTNAVYDGEGGDEEEKILLRLRTSRGISLSDKNERFIKKAELFSKNGFAEINGDIFSLTARGYLISNSIISELLNVY